MIFHIVNSVTIHQFAPSPLCEVAIKIITMNTNEPITKCLNEIYLNNSKRVCVFENMIHFPFHVKCICLARVTIKSYRTAPLKSSSAPPLQHNRMHGNGKVCTSF